ncbi:hypothetical protein HDE_12273 [Halotydeus destructor]|nr:hypothetical protein HDE_12273 [Halotydeus destructor]
MFRRKLLALQYYDMDKFDVNNEQEKRKLIAWLEDQVIRHYTAEGRAQLRDIDSTNWSEAFQQYLKDLACPFEWTKTSLVLDWILALAVRLEYEDNADMYGEQSKSGAGQQGGNAEPQFSHSNPLDSLDFGSNEFREGVSQLAALLKVPEHPNHLITLGGICRLIENSFSGEKIEEKRIKQSQLRLAKTGAPDLTSMNLGFNSGDKVVDRAMKVLRLLYINDLKELQTAVNHTIVKAQSITANPKTDTTLGKTGHG